MGSKKYLAELFGLLFGLLLLAPSVSAQSSTVSPEQQLADLYVPVVYVREQAFECAPTPDGGEPYLPLPVEMVLDNPRVLIRDGADSDHVVAQGVGAAELATYGPDTYMDFPGDPRRPGCVFETDERIRVEELGLEPTTYARVVFDEEGQRLALQYWFFWYFNDWNNTHESDWEMIQIMWDDIGSVDEALQTPPTATGFSQHDGGELGKWGDDKLQVEDETHLRVYPAAGSHATFYDNQTYLGWGENGSGFGCDVSSGPSERTPVKAVLVDEDPDPNGEFAWLLYEGRWGERQPSVFNGPLGPAFNGRWIDPWQKIDNWRTTSIVIPTSSTTLGPTVTSAFCTLSEAGSLILIYAMVFPFLTLPLVIVVIGALVYFYFRARNLFQRAWRLYREHWKIFLGIGLLALPIGIVFNVIQKLLLHRGPIGYMMQWFDDTTGARLSAVLAIGSVQQLAMLFIISPAVVQAVADIHSGRQPAILRSFRMASRRTLAIVGSVLILVVFIGIPLVTIIGIPVAIWLIIRWQFFIHELMFDTQTTSFEALHESALKVRNRWWKTFFSLMIFDLLATVPGIVVGFGLMTLGGTAVGFANSISSLLYAVAIPLAVIATTLMFLDRRGNKEVDPVSEEA